MSNILSDVLQRLGKTVTESKTGAWVKNLFLAALLVGQVGCASTSTDSTDNSSDFNQPKHDDSNGWGTGFKVAP